MIEANVNVFDAIVLAIMALSSVLAFFRGFVREVLSLGAWVGAAVVTLYFFPSVAEQLQPKFKSAVVAAGFSTLGIYVAALIGFSIINMAILKFVKSGSDVGLLDNWLGMIFGVLRGALLISLAFFLMTIAMPEDEYPAVMKQSMSLPYVEEGGVLIAKIAPKYLRDISSLRKRAEEEGASSSSDYEDDEKKNPWAEEKKRLEHKRKIYEE